MTTEHLDDAAPHSNWNESTDPLPFLFEGEVLVRVLERDGRPWFVAKDVCLALGIVWKGSDSTGNLGTMEADEKGTGKIHTFGGPQEVVVVSEGGLYSLIFKSRKPQAIKFQKWVTSEVLPSLRQTGGYGLRRKEGSSKPLERQSYDEWSLEQRRTALSEVNTVRHVMSQAAAVWMWKRTGLPMPPKHLLPAWAQADLDVGGCSSEGRNVTIVMPAPETRQ